MDITVKESEIFESLSKSIALIKQLCRQAYKDGKEYKSYGGQLRKLYDIRLNYAMQHVSTL